MIDGYQIYDADAHVNVAPQMREDLPKELAMAEAEDLIR